VTRGNVRFIYDYRKTHPDDDPYKKAIGDFRRGIRPEGWEEYAQKRVEGRKKTHLITEEFTVGDLASHVEEDDKVYKEIIRKWVRSSERSNAFSFVAYGGCSANPSPLTHTIRKYQRMKWDRFTSELSHLRA